jgi:hypothetical protein
MQFLQKHHDKFIYATSILGANIGAYIFVIDDKPYHRSILKTCMGAIIGGSVGWGVGFLFPYIVTSSVVALPGYALAKRRSSLLK